MEMRIVVVGGRGRGGGGLVLFTEALTYSRYLCIQVSRDPEEVDVPLFIYDSTL